MKYDLLFSDIVASFAGIFGLLAAAITLQKAMLHWSNGDPMVATNMTVFALLLFLFSRCFLVSRSYDKMLSLTTKWSLRLPFILFCFLWLSSIAYVFYTTSPWDLVGIPSQLPWLFSVNAVFLLLLPFTLAFILPGFAFRPYRTVNKTPPKTLPQETIEHNVFNKDTDQKLGRRYAGLPTWFRWPVLVWLGFTMFPTFVQMMGQNFLPSPEHVASVREIALVSGVITALSFLWLLSLGAHYSNKIGKWGKGFIVLFAPVLGFLFGSSAASNAIPMVRAMASGVETQMVFTVAGYKRSVDRRCSNPITLEGLPFLSGRLCGFSEDLGNSLQIGDEVMVFGRGTADGLFVKFAARLKPIENDASSGLAE